jgi:hypothetical protein
MGVKGPGAGAEGASMTPATETVSGSARTGTATPARASLGRHAWVRILLGGLTLRGATVVVSFVTQTPI